MPMLRFKGIPKEQLKSVSTLLIEDLHNIIGCPKDYFTLELIENSFIFDSMEVMPSPIIEIAWFDRGQTVQDLVATCITNHFKKYTDCLEVYFIPLKECNYYENGMHY